MNAPVKTLAQLYQSERCERFASVERAADAPADAPLIGEDRTLWISAASSTPVQRWWVTETLEVSESAVDPSYLDAGAASLWNHDSDKLIGVVSEWRIEGDKLRVRVRFGRGELAEGVVRDINDGILRHVSIGYSVQKWTETEGGDEVTVTRWTPIEVSFVSCPADVTVGVGRSVYPRQEPPKQLEIDMTPDELKALFADVITAACGDEGAIRKAVGEMVDGLREELRAEFSKPTEDPAPESEPAEAPESEPAEPTEAAPEPGDDAERARKQIAQSSLPSKGTVKHTPPLPGAANDRGSRYVAAFKAARERGLNMADASREAEKIAGHQILNNPFATEATR